MMSPMTAAKETTMRGTSMELELDLLIHISKCSCAQKIITVIFVILLTKK